MESKEPDQLAPGEEGEVEGSLCLELEEGDDLVLESRGETRVRHRVKVSVARSASLVELSSLNVSAGGLYVRASSHLPNEGDTLRIHIWPGDGQEPFEVTGKVRHVVPPNVPTEIPSGFGIQFIEVPEATKRRWSKYVRSVDDQARSANGGYPLSSDLVASEKLPAAPADYGPVRPRLDSATAVLAIEDLSHLLESSRNDDGSDGK